MRIYLALFLAAIGAAVSAATYMVPMDSNGVVLVPAFAKTNNLATTTNLITTSNSLYAAIGSGGGGGVTTNPVFYGSVSINPVGGYGSLNLNGIYFGVIWDLFGITLGNYNGPGQLYIDDTTANFGGGLTVNATEFAGAFRGDAGTTLTNIQSVASFPGQPRWMVWGDSMTRGGPYAPFYPYADAFRNMMPWVSVTNYSYPQKTADYISSNYWRVVSTNPEITNLCHIFWMGNVGGTDTTATNNLMTNYAAVTASIANSNYVVLSLVGNTFFNGSQWDNLTNVNNMLSNKFGAHYYDLNARMLALSTNNANELAQADSGMIASNRLRFDYIHFTQLGYMTAGTNIAQFAGPLFYPHGVLVRTMSGSYWDTTYPANVRMGDDGVTRFGMPTNIYSQNAMRAAVAIDSDTDTPLVSFGSELTAGGGYCGNIWSWVTPVGNERYAASLRLFGSVYPFGDVTSQTNGDPRTVVLKGFTVTTNAYDGGAFLLEVKAAYQEQPPFGGVSEWNNTFFVDQFGKTFIGNLGLWVDDPAYLDNTNCHPQGWLQIRGQSTNTPALVLEPGSLTLVPRAKGALENDGTNMWYTTGTSNRFRLLMTGMSGTNLATGSINSNQLDAATWAAAVAGGGGGISQATLDSSNYVSRIVLAGSNFVSSNILSSSNFLTLAALQASNFVSSNILAGSNFLTLSALNASNFVSSNVLSASNYVTLPALNASNFVTSNLLYSSNFITSSRLGTSNYCDFPTLATSNFVKQASLNGSNFCDFPTLATSNFVKQVSLNNSNFINLLSLQASNFVSSNILSGSNFMTLAALQASNFVSSNILSSSNFLTLAALQASNFVSSNILAGSNFLTLPALNASNFVTSNLLYSSNFISEGRIKTSNYLQSITGNAVSATNVQATNIAMNVLTWTGPTNLLYMNNADNFYAASLNCSITNAIGTGWAMLWVSNASGGNITIYPPAGRMIGPGTTNALVLASAHVAIVSIKTFGLMTNVATATEQ